MEGRKDGWVVDKAWLRITYSNKKAGLRIAYSNQKSQKWPFSKFKFLSILNFNGGQFYIEILNLPSRGGRAV